MDKKPSSIEKLVDRNMKNVKHSQEVKDFILDKSEEARMRRRTIHSLKIGASGEDVELSDE